MAYNEDRIRAALSEAPRVSERKMFGRLCLMLNGNMLCGVTRDELIARVGPAEHELALSRLYIGPGGTSAQADLAAWVSQCLAHARSLPPKT